MPVRSFLLSAVTAMGLGAPAIAQTLKSDYTCVARAIAPADMPSTYEDLKFAMHFTSLMGERVGAKTIGDFVTEAMRELNERDASLTRSIQRNQEDIRLLEQFGVGNSTTAQNSRDDAAWAIARLAQHRATQVYTVQVDCLHGAGGIHAALPKARTTGVVDYHPINLGTAMRRPDGTFQLVQTSPELR